jgi:hypothetical protein
MKKLLLAVGLAVLVAGSAQAVSVSLVPSALTVNVSEDFVIDVVITGAQAPGVEVVNVVIAYDPSLVAALDAVEGPFLPSQQPGEFLMEFENMTYAPGVASYTVARLGPASSTGSGTAASITFHCEGNGLTLLAWNVVLADVDGNPIADVSGEVAVQQGAIPEPMTLLLIGGALAALGVVARKRS